MKRKELIFYFVASLFSIMLMCYIALKPSEERLMSLVEAESLAPTEESDVYKLTCYCSLLHSQNCATDNWGSECASGKNVKCWTYNRNCS